MNESLSDFGPASGTPSCTAPKRGSPADKSIRRVRLLSILCNEDGADGAQPLRRSALTGVPSC